MGEARSFPVNFCSNAEQASRVDACRSLEPKAERKLRGRRDFKRACAKPGTKARREPLRFRQGVFGVGHQSVPCPEGAPLVQVTREHPAGNQVLVGDRRKCCALAPSQLASHRQG